jgi:hypothetical protein
VQLAASGVAISQIIRVEAMFEQTPEGQPYYQNRLFDPAFDARITSLKQLFFSHSDDLSTEPRVFWALA